MKKDSNNTKISEKITLKLEKLEKEYNSELSEFKEGLDRIYGAKKKLLLGQNELENFINSIDKNVIIPALITFLNLI